MIAGVFPLVVFFVCVRRAPGTGRAKPAIGTQRPDATQVVWAVAGAVLGQELAPGERDAVGLVPP